jgi:peptide-methionine (S)-S-oxide reductase
MAIIELGLGGGCHWCTEAVFQSLHGVSNVRQGFLSGEAPWDAPSEGVLLELDEDAVPLRVLLEIHLRTHASGAEHSMRKKYRSAVYVPCEALGARVAEVIRELSPWLGFEPVTKVLSLRSFRLNEERFLNYRRSRPEAPFCRTYIDPKLALLRREYRAFVDS